MFALLGAYPACDDANSTYATGNCNWTFSPLYPDRNSRGYAFDGTWTASTSETFAWTAWVE